MIYKFAMLLKEIRTCFTFSGTFRLNSGKVFTIYIVLRMFHT
jgi:hypothetical protein